MYYIESKAADYYTQLSVQLAADVTLTFAAISPIFRNAAELHFKLNRPH